MSIIGGVVVPASVMLRIGRGLGLSTMLLAVTPSAALGHAGGTISTSYEARIAGFTAPEHGVAAQVIGGDQDVLLTVTPPHVVVVLGVLGEPFLRFSPAGVEVNRASPTAAGARVLHEADLLTAHAPVWIRIRGGDAFMWHESRLRPRAVRGSAARSGPVATWRIPMIVDGGRTALAGREWYRRAPPLGGWLLFGALLVGSAAAAALVQPQHVLRKAAVGLTAVVLGAWTLGWDGVLLDGRPSTSLVALAVAWPVAAAALVAAVARAARGSARMAALGAVGAIVMTFSVPELPAFSRGYVLSALGDDAARASVVLSLAGGLALLILGTPSIAAVLRDDPLRRRLLGNDEVAV